MVVRTRKAGLVLSILVVAAGWAAKAPMLVQWFNNGLISGITFLLLFCTVISLITGAIAVQRDKRGAVSFSLHAVFASLACLLTHFIFVVPLALGVFVAIGALVWPAESQQKVADETAV